MKKIFKISNSEYAGEYKDGLRHGQGTWTSSNGDKYIGEFKNNKRNGKGTYTLGDGPNKGDKYVGKWKNDLNHGQGIFTFEDGRVFKGTWKDGKVIKKLNYFKND